jgi:hypothetical protein
MTLTGMKKHVGVLERAGLVTTEKVGRVRTAASSACALSENWRHGSRGTGGLGHFRRWTVVEEMTRKERSVDKRE